MLLSIKNRYTAFACHFSVSLLIFLIFVFILFNFWYPTPYFTASGGWQGLKIVAAVDLILGPALTLIIFNLSKPKKELILDFSIIALVQISALIWGITTVYSQRPVASVFWESGFYTVSASALEKGGISYKQLDTYGTERPVYIFAEKPQTEEDQEQMINAILEQKIPPYQQISLFRPIEQHYPDIYKHNVDIVDVIAKNNDMRIQIESILTTSGTVLESNHYIPLISKYRNIILIYNSDNQIIGTASAPYKNNWHFKNASR